MGGRGGTARLGGRPSRETEKRLDTRLSVSFALPDNAEFEVLRLPLAVIRHRTNRLKPSQREAS